MKQIQIILRPEKVEAVKETLVGLGIKGMTVVPVEGFGNQLGHTEVYRGVKMEARLLRKVLVILVVPDAMVANLIPAIRGAAATGEIGDGKIVISDVSDVVRIRTGESGEQSLV